MIRCLSSSMLMLWCAALIQAGEKPQPKQAKKQTPLQQAYQKQRELYQKQQALRKKINDSDDLKQFHEDVKQAEGALNETLDAARNEARKKEQAARAALQAVIDKRISQSKEIAELKKKYQDLEQQKRDLDFQIDLAQFKINHRNSPVQQALDADPDLAKLKKAADAAPVKERFAARANYLKARQQKLKALKQAKALLDDIEKAREKYQKVEKVRFQIRLAVDRAKSKIERSDDKEMKELRDKWMAARQQMVRVVFQPDIKKLRSAVANARSTQLKKLNELLAASKEMQSLRDQIDAVRKEIRNLLSDKQKKPE